MVYIVGWLVITVSSVTQLYIYIKYPYMFRSNYDHLQKAQQHVEETTITLVIVHQIE
jgi:hypothetical protein